MPASLAWVVVVALAGHGGGLDEARELLRKGLLSEAERILAPLAAEAGSPQRSPALLLLGNVDYERGRYESALARYAEAEREGGADEALVAAARGNRQLTAERLDRARRLATLEARLRAGTAAALALGAVAVAWLARRSRCDARTAAPGD
jgi:tetratricopeptide (TPR) repeat protein